MIHLAPRTRLLAASLSALAGYVDAIGFLGTGGFFVSFMSGNSTRLGVGLSQHVAFAVTAAAFVGAFVAGVVSASLIVGRVPLRRTPVVLLIVAVALAIAAAIAPVAPRVTSFALVAFAMGAVNLMFEAEGEVRVGLTYMTGTLVKLGHRIALALSGGDRWQWLPFLLLWSSLIAGGALGGVTYLRFGLAALWPAAIYALLLALLLRKMPLAEPAGANV